MTARRREIGLLRPTELQGLILGCSTPPCSSPAGSWRPSRQKKRRQGHPLFPFGFPFGALPVGSTFSSSSATGIGLDLLAVLALLVVLSRIGGSSVSLREGFRLVSSPRLVTELPG